MGTSPVTQFFSPCHYPLACAPRPLPSLHSLQSARTSDPGQSRASASHRPPKSDLPGCAHPPAIFATTCARHAELSSGTTRSSLHSPLRLRLRLSLPLARLQLRLHAVRLLLGHRYLQFDRPQDD